MKVLEIKMWRFRCFGSIDPSTDGQSDPKPVRVAFDPEITALIGRNGAGKSALLEALQRMFGETRDERMVRQDDFFVPPGQTLESEPKREMFIELIVAFPELQSGESGAENTVPSGFQHMIVEAPGQTPIVRIRLEATWQASGTLDGTIEENMFWILTTDAVPFGDVDDKDLKRKVTAVDRACIAVRYIPASRDITALTRLTIRSLGRSLMQSVTWKDDAKIKDLLAKAGAALDAEEALKRVNGAINACWSQLNAADTETTARLTVLPPDFQQVLRGASILLEPSATGRTLGIEDLSDGQRSLFHFALVKSLLEFKLGLEKEVLAMKQPPFTADFIRAPALTIFAFEEPENHLAPYYLSRLLTELQKLAGTIRVQGVITSHSPAIVGRLDPKALRYIRRNSASGISLASPLLLPPDTDEAAKFVREAVRAHPEIYFARHAVFGEGASEEIVLPRLAQALGVAVDPSFVAIVPVGGRHVHHFWRLADQLGISYTTLLDLDLGRSSGDVMQIKTLASAMLNLKATLDSQVKKNLDAAMGLDREAGWGGENGWDLNKLKGWVDFCEALGVFFSSPLDLDMLMLEAFPLAYRKLPPSAHGPQKPKDAQRQEAAAERVLGEGGFGRVVYADTETMAQFPWYSYLFLGDRGKPAVHLSALAQLDDKTLAKNCPANLKRLVGRVKSALEDAGP